MRTQKFKKVKVVGMTSYDKKSTTEEIRERFDKDVERFSNLDTGQGSTMDAALSWNS